MTNKEGVVDAGSGNEVQTKIIAESDSNASFLRAARAGNLEKVREYLKGSIDINTSNANGLNALHLASKEGHVPVVLELVKNGANVNAATKKGNTALHIASLAGQEEVVKILIRSGANANVQSQNGFTPLYMAAQENHDGVVKFLLANSANQSLATEDGFTPLAVALQQGHDKVVAVLLENDAKGRVRLPALHIAAKKDDTKAAALLLQNDHDPDVTSKSGFTPLHIAAHYGNENIASLLLDKNADVNYSAKHQITPLHVAAKWGKSNMVTLLVDKGAKIDASTRDGLTPLHCAARSGHDQVVDLLLEKGAPITAKTKNGLAPLHMASQGDHVDSARILLFHKAPVDDVTVDYLTALHVAAHCGHVRVAKLLLDRKADPNSRALNGFTPLHIACKKNRIKVVELLLKHGASIEATTESGLTPLHVASFMGCMNIVIYLIQHGANPDVPTVRGETPLHLAARANQSDIIRILLRNGAHVDASAREQQTPLHIAARLGNVDIVGLLLQHGAAVDATTKDMYTALHIAAKEGQEEVASVLLDHGASLTATTKKGFTPLHLAAKYGNIKVAQLLLQKDAPVDAQGKNGVTPLHVAAHYDHVNVALLLLDKGAFPHATAKNGYTPLHIAAKKNQMDIATTLLEYGAKPTAESKAGFTPLHLAAQEGHTDMTTLLIEHHADVNSPAKNGLTPLHLCAQEDKVNVGAILVKNGAKVDPPTKAGYTPLHVACHFGQINMIRFLLQHKADVNATTSHGYTPLHQAAQQGHTLIINLLLEHKASPNTTTNQGQTALSIAQRLGYISVVETLKIVTETIVTTTTTTVTEEKYKVVAPETMQETFMSDSEDEGAEDTMMGDQSLHYMTTDELKALADDNTLGIDVTRDERGTDSMLTAPLTAEEDHLTPQHVIHQEATFSSTMAPDNVDLARAPVHAGKLKWKTFLVSFMVDARGGAMRGCRHSGVRVIIPPRKAPMPMRITCRYLRKEKLAYPPPLMEGEACASRILEVGPSGAKFLGPVIIEVPHFASLRGREREITILRSDNGESWREHTLEASDDAVHDVFNESFEGEELSAIEDLSTSRITRILTTDFPQYFAIVTRVRQEVHAIGPEGGMVSSTVVPQVQAIFPEGALTKKIKVGLQAQPITPELVTKLLGNRVAVSPIVTVEPRRRKFHKPITLTIPVPQAATKGMINQYSGDAPTLRLLCSITGGTTKAQWEDVTGSTPLTFVNDCVSFTTTVSARFWLMDCRQVNEATKFATELYREAIHVPFMAKFVVFAKRHDPLEAQLRVFCMTDDKEDKTLESQEHFTEVAKSRDVEVLEGKPQYLEFGGNLVPVTKSGEQLSLTFQAFRENRLPFTIRVKDPHQEPIGRVAFMKEPRVGRGEPPQSPICNLNIVLPETDLTPMSELITLEKKYGFVKETGLAKPELIHRADLRLSDIAKELKDDWVLLALQLDVPESDINTIRSENPGDTVQQALLMLRHWLQRSGSKATGNLLEKGLRKINREDIVNHCMFNVELVTDDVEKAVAKVHLDQSGFDTFKEELGSSRDASLRRDTSLNGTYDEQDIMKDAESAAETSSESSDKDHYKSESRHIVESRSTAESAAAKKAFEEAPETLVQTVPTALAESFTQQVTNGQLDGSMHEEDRSEPTAATLSSEATAELEVSSLEDKSHGEAHVERRDKYPRFGHTQYRSGTSLSSNKMPAKESPKKMFQQLMRKPRAEIEKRKVSFEIRYRTMTPPATARKRKVITRRKSWPADSPLKLNKRKKYQQRLKIEDLREPFWTDTYEWLIMKTCPEAVRQAPIATLLEFKQMDAVTDLGRYVYINSNMEKLKHSSSQLIPNKKPCLSNSKFPETVHFYFLEFLNKKPKCEADKKYIQNLRKHCMLEELKSHTIPSIKPTNFDANSVENVSSVAIDCSKSATFNRVSNMSSIAIREIDIECFPQNDFSQNIQEPKRRLPPQHDVYRPLQNVSTRSLRPLQSSNVDVSADVLTCSPTADINSHFFMKQKIIKDDLCNKENVHQSNNPKTENIFQNHGKMRRDNIENISHPIKSQKQVHLKSSVESKINLLDRYPTNKPPNSKVIVKPVPFKEGIYSCPRDVPDNNQQTFSKKCPEISQTSQDTGKTSVSYSSVSEVQPSAVSQGSSQEGFGSKGGPSNKPYLKQLFEQDIQSNFAKSQQALKDREKEDMSESDKDESKEVIEVSSEVKSSSDILISKDISQNITKNVPSDSNSAEKGSKTIPATVLGQSFLKSLQERVQAEGITEGSSFPASVIGHAFLNVLQEQQNSLAEKSCDSKPIPSSVVGQTFLKCLIFEESSSDSKEKLIPAPVIGQTFLKTLTEQISPKPPSPPIIPASVIGQSFLKTIIEKTDEVPVKEQLIFASPDQKVENAEQPLLRDVTEKPIPASVIGQSFLKTLTEHSAENVEKQPIPAAVIGQAFLKDLLSDQNSTESNISAQESDMEQFAKRKADETESISECSSSKSIPASVVGQTFLKTLTEQLNIEHSNSKSEVAKPIPAPVIGQTFLKSLLADQQTTPDSNTKQAIPASVVSQTFLKSLTDHQTSENDSESSSKTIPAPVVGQAFLKTLLECQEAYKTESKKPIPSSVVGQTFLKSLTDTAKHENDQSISESSGQAEFSDKDHPIPATVIGQSFIKALMQEQETLSAGGESRVMPASVIGQVFLKTLETESKGKEESPEASSKLTIGHLSEETETKEKIEDKPLPACVIGQAFLKSLVQEKEQSTLEETKEAPIPSSVVSQVFLKNLVENSAPSTGVKSEAVPSTIVAQSFLKTLLEESPQTFPSQTMPENSQKACKHSEAVIPSSVVGLSFLKTLTEQSKIDSTSSENVQSFEDVPSENPIPASVIGQAFLKTLMNVSTEMNSSAVSRENRLHHEQVLTSEGNGCSSCSQAEDLKCHTESGVFDSEIHKKLSSNNSFDISEDQSIIPPPPEFSSVGDLAAASSVSQPTETPRTDLNPEIIGELLSYTKMMHSVLESMKEESTSQSNITKTESSSQIENRNIPKQK
ncbi:ankyrin-2-like isoform X4 [Uloborus diversus]|uniref:ankyrin-2-like isoform X4 n=1 Tax=Uloborus diversus TaxID=327109 RepID=UPI00240A1BD3|nr:ankyrin-2-like isoform X4 [Uloborus diversus]